MTLLGVIIKGELERDTRKDGKKMNLMRSCKKSISGKKPVYTRGNFLRGEGKRDIESPLESLYDRVQNGCSTHCLRSSPGEREVQGRGSTGTETRSM